MHTACWVLCVLLFLTAACVISDKRRDSPNFKGIEILSDK